MADDAITYSDAGVDTAAGAAAVDGIRAAVQRTYRPEVIGDIGGFGGLFDISACKDMEQPVLVSGTDGVGTKLALAQMLDRPDTVGIDLVAMCVNDILVTGAEPLFFLDYIAIGKLEPDLVERIVAGVAEGCAQAGCSLVGGEMAEHPGVMDPADYDLSGFCVGVVDKPKALDGSTVAAGDRILGLASSGIHSNGYSLVRRAAIEGHEERLTCPLDDAGEETLADALMAPTRIYVRAVRALLVAGIPVKAMAHITGGGITENLNRSLPATVDARIVRGSWPVPPVISYVCDCAHLSEDEAYKTFNMGIGFMLIVAPEDVAAASAVLTEAGEQVYEVGSIVGDGSGSVVYSC